MTFPAPKPEPTVVDEDYRGFIRGRPCLACLHADGTVWFGCDAAHVHTKRNAGDKENLLPLCRSHHAEQHRMGIRTFARKYGLDLEASARSYWQFYKEVYELAF